MSLLVAFGTALLAGVPLELPYGEKGNKYTAGCVRSGPGDIFDRAVAIIHAHMRAIYGLEWTGTRPKVALNPDPKETDEVKFQNLAKKYSYGRRIYLTEKGWLGLGPAAMLPGDHVCVLIGGHVPFVLRPRTPKGWLLVGEAYIHELWILLGRAANEVVHSWFRCRLEIFDIY